MIRRATIDDLSSLLQMAEDFKNSSPYKELEFQKEFVIQNITSMLINPLFAIFIAENAEGIPVGMLAGVVTNQLFSTAPTAGELVWWVNPEARNSKVGSELHSSFQQWAINKGCLTASMVLLENGDLEIIDKMYEQMGYSPAERSYFKVL